MMEPTQFDDLRARSASLFNNALVVPIAVAILDRENSKDGFGAAEIRQQLGGAAADNQIRQVLKRLEACELLLQLPYPGRPHPRMWQRLDGPFWAFIESWATATATQPEPVGDPGFEPGTSSLSETRSNQLS